MWHRDCGVARRGKPRHGDKPYVFPSFRSLEEWERFADWLRTHILVNCGLYGLDLQSPLNPRFVEKIEREGYTIEKVFFESFPGFLVTGNLYRPTGGKGPFPGVACPHGHWRNGRLANEEVGSVPGRCINLARQGYVVFSYDMIGYNDSFQVPHRDFGGKRLYLWGISMMGLQLMNSVRVIDFLQSLEDVDPERIGCTGTSGGGTQTFMLMSIDERVKVSAPVCMISSHFQGGCICENAPNLRTEAFNVEIAALMAPRPMIMISTTGDWTANTPFIEYPAVKSIYDLYGASERLGTHQADAPHNYNKESREAMYAWFGKWLLGEDDPTKLKEKPFTVEKDDDLLVFSRHPKPDNVLSADELANELISCKKRAIEKMTPIDSESLGLFRESMRPALAHAISLTPEIGNHLCVDPSTPVRKGNVVGQDILINHPTGSVPATLFYPIERRGGAVLLVSGSGRSSIAGSAGEPSERVRSLVSDGNLVMAIDPFMVGENGDPEERAAQMKIRYFETFNRTDAAEVATDVIASIAFLGSFGGVTGVSVCGFGSPGVPSLIGAALSDKAISVAVDFDGFDSSADSEWVERFYIPCIRSAGDIRTAAALLVPARLLIHNAVANDELDWIDRLYGTIGCPENLIITGDRLDVDRVIDWIRSR